MTKLKNTICAVCGNEAGFFGSRKLPDGSRVCGKCLKLIPPPFLDRQYACAQDAVDGAEYGNLSIRELSPRFTATAQYGRMFLDERNGLITVCDTTDIKKDGTLKSPSPAVYPCAALTNARFSIDPAGSGTGPVRARNGEVICQVTFSADLQYCGAHLRETIRKTVPCTVVPDGEGGGVWQEPYDMSAFRSCYAQAAEDAWRRAKWEEDRVRREEKERRRAYEEAERRQEEARAAMEHAADDRVRDARILFMLDEDYTEADLRRQRAALMRAFHPDNGRTADQSYAQKINEAYECLYEAIKRRNTV